MNGTESSCCVVSGSGSDGGVWDKVTDGFEKLFIAFFIQLLFSFWHVEARIGA